MLTNQAICRSKSFVMTVTATLYTRESPEFRFTDY